MNTRFLVRLAALTVPAATLVAATQVPAQAVTPTGYLTLHQDQYQGGAVRILPVSHPKLKNAGFNDKASSVYNRTPNAWVVYEDTGYQGDRWCIRPGESVDDLHLNPWRFGDEISAVKQLTGPSCYPYRTFF
jgi:hypothetical protein